MKSILIFVAVLVISVLARPDPSSEEIEDLQNKITENTLDLFVERLEEWEETFEKLSDDDKNVMIKILEERVHSMKRFNEVSESDESSEESESSEDSKLSEESESSEDSKSSEDSASEEEDDLIAESFDELPFLESQMETNEFQSRIEEFWRSQEEWLAKWREMSQERRKALEDFIRERMNEISNVINRSARKHGHHQEGPHDPEVKAQIKEAIENVIDFIRERVKEETPSFPQENDKGKIKEMFSKLPEDFQKLLSWKMEKMEKKFNRMSEEKREKIFMDIREKFSSLPDKETREKNFNAVMEALNNTKQYIESRLEQENSDFPNDKDFQQGRETIESLPEYISKPILARFEKMQAKFNAIPEEKKEKARQKMQKRIRRVLRKSSGHHHQHPMPYNILELMF
jgi:hypothetical protein